MLKKLMLLFGATLLIIAFLVTSLLNRVSEDRQLAKEIVELAKSGETEIALSPLTDFEWDQAKVYGPYTSKDVIEESLNVKYSGSINGLDSRDDMFLLVFAKGRHAVKTVELSREPGNYYEKNGTMTPENDRLLVEKK